MSRQKPQGIRVLARYPLATKPRKSRFPAQREAYAVRTVSTFTQPILDGVASSCQHTRRQEGWRCQGVVEGSPLQRKRQISMRDPMVREKQLLRAVIFGLRRATTTPPFFPSLQRPRKENNAKRANCPTHRRRNRGAQGRRRRHCSLTSRNASTDGDVRTGCTNVCTGCTSVYTGVCTGCTSVCTGCTKPGNRVPKPSPSTMGKPKMRTTHAAKKRAWRSGAVSTCDKRDKNLTPPPFFGSL